MKSLDYYAMLGLLIDLDVLQAEGHGDGAKAEEIRDLSDPIWYRLTEEEKRSISHRSEALYKARGQEPHG